MALPFLFDACDWLAYVSLVPWLLALERTPHRAFLRGYVAGWLWLVLGLAWLGRVALPANLLAASYFALYPAAFAAIVARLRHRGGFPLWVAAPLTWVLCELLAEHVTVFNVTWLFLGHAAWRVSPLLQCAELGGISLLSALLVLTSAVAVTVGGALAARRPGALRERAVLLPVTAWLVLAALAVGYGTWRLRSLELRDGPSVAVVQGNVPLSERLDPARADAVLMKHAAMTRGIRERPVLIAWPESTSSAFLEADDVARAFLGTLARDLNTSLLVGAIGVNPAPRPPSNSAFLFAPDGSMQARADKHILVPGAETLLFLDAIPWIRRPVCDWLSKNMHFRPYLEPGRDAVLMTAGGVKFGSLICYDDLVPAPAAQLREKGAEALVVLSNETWFGEREMDQHLAMATVRCVETRLPMVRSTNDGLSCAIDPGGRVTQVLPRHRDGVLVVPLRRASTWIVPPWVRLAVRLSCAAAVLVLLTVTLARPRSAAP